MVIYCCVDNLFSLFWSSSLEQAGPELPRGFMLIGVAAVVFVSAGFCGSKEQPELMVVN